MTPSTKAAAQESSAADVDYVARVHALGPTIVGFGDQIEREQRLPQDLLAQMHEAGLFKILVPKVYGGGEVTPMALYEIMIAVAQYDGSTAWCLGQLNGCSLVAAALEPSVVDEIWGQPQGAMGWGVGRGQAKREGDGFRLNGSWMFCSGGHHATWLGAQYVALVDENGEPEGKAAKSEDNATVEPRLWTMLFPADKATFNDVWDVVGLRGTGSDGYAVKDLYVEDKYVFRRDDFDSVRVKTPLYAYYSNTIYATSFAAVAVGLARGILEGFKELATEKAGRFGKTPLKDNAFAQAEVAVAEARLRAARGYMLNELNEIWKEIVETGVQTSEQRMRLRLATTFTIQEAKAAADIAYHLAGATAIFANLPFERRYRDLHAVTQQVQGHKVHYQTVGAYLMGHEPEFMAI